jgi:hypothetical protein
MLANSGYGGSIGGTSFGVEFGGPLWMMESEIEADYAELVQDAFDNPSTASIPCQQDQVTSTITADANSPAVTPLKSSSVAPFATKERPARAIRSAR